MSAHCCEHDAAPVAAIVDLPRYRRVLWAALLLNAALLCVELVAGWRAGALSLLADAINFGGDAPNNGVSLAALALQAGWAVRRLARAELALAEPQVQTQRQPQPLPPRRPQHHGHKH